MAKNNHLTFTQSSIQDYIECPRRFELRHVLKTRWPARIVDSAEEMQNWMELGSRFHYILFQYFIGLDPAVLENTIQDVILAEWWQNFLTWVSNEKLTGKQYPEHSLYADIAGHKVAAKFDLIIHHDNGSMSITDWKTSRKRPPDSFLQSRVQSCLYPLVLSLSGMDLKADRQPVAPENVEMLYWFANYPYDPLVIQYDQAKFERDLTYITDLILEISSIEPGGFALVEDQKTCRFCSYRSLCKDGLKPGSFDEMAHTDNDSELSALLQSLDNGLDQIGEAWL